jgi:predicted Zn-dependent protease
LLFFAARLLPRLGGTLGRQARKPFRQARWMWSWVAGSEDESVAAEFEYGRECACEFAAQFPGSVPAASQELVAAVGSRLAAAVKDPRRQFRFAVVSAPANNAFALPGGFVFVTQPLLDLCAGDGDEIAFLLGHEMAHILRGHVKDQLTAGVLLSAVTSRLPAAGQMLREVLNKGYSRDLELEADRDALPLARTAGFDPRAALRALHRLAQVSAGAEGLGEYFSTHPSFAARVRELEQQLAR